jgi:hypothetical protein
LNLYEQGAGKINLAKSMAILHVSGVVCEAQDWEGGPGSGMEEKEDVDGPQ